MISFLKGKKVKIQFIWKELNSILSRLLQSQADTKFNVLNFTIDGYMEYVAKVNAAPVKEKFSENRRLELHNKHSNIFHDCILLIKDKQLDGDFSQWGLHPLDGGGVHLQHQHHLHLSLWQCQETVL